MDLFKKYVNQTRKPEGFLGKLMVAGMNGGHAKLADWGMEKLSGLAPKTIAELGCGGGRNAGELLKRYPDAVLTAIDYSTVSVEKAKNSAILRCRPCLAQAVPGVRRPDGGRCPRRPDLRPRLALLSRRRKCGVDAVRCVPLCAVCLADFAGVSQEA